SVEEVMAIWADPAKRMEAINSMSDKQSYKALVASMDEEVGKFEENTLSPFYQKLRDAIRKTGSKQALFLEHNYFCNMGVKSNITVPVDKNGKADDGCVFAAHGYDLVVDTDQADQPGTERVEVIFETIFEGGKRMNLPVVVGEWGAYYSGEAKYLDPCRQIIDHLEENLSGQTYWCYGEGFDKQACFELISRAYPAATSGELLSYKNDFNQKRFTLEWSTKANDLSTPTVLYFPDLNRIDKNSLKNKDFDFELSPIANQKSGYLKIKPKKAGSHSYILTY
ncbi:MAG: cellulase family glycosylhydrolase, partial [Bacteroidales bacterium]